MSLSTICTNALKELSGFEVPTSFYGNGNQTATLAVALANREGQTLEKEVRWSELVTEHTFSTVSGTAAYSKPSDFRAFANCSVWDRTNQWRITTPIPSLVWQWLKSGITVASNMNKWMMVRGAYLTIYPTPTVSSETIAFDYYSKSWITKQADSSNVAAWTADNDTARIDEDLITMGLKWRLLQARGFPYEPEYREYESVKESLRDDNGGRGVINLGQQHRGRLIDMLPDTGYGQ